MRRLEIDALRESTSAPLGPASGLNNTAGTHALLDSDIHIQVLGVNFKTAPISVREQIARRTTVDRLVDLKNTDLKKSGAELVLLSTCNRVEIYFAAEQSQAIAQSLISLFEGEAFRPASEVDFQIYQYQDRKAIEHLFSVAAGLDSLVIGEAQILSQVRDSCKVSNERGMCGPVLSKLFSKAYSTGREIREAYPRFTNGFKNSVSMSVVELISRYYQTQNGESDYKPNLLLVGSGKMIRLAVNSLDKPRFGRVVVAARKSYLKDITADHIVHISELAETIRENRIDVIITATSSENYILTPNDLAHVTSELHSSKKRPLLIIDISVPRNVDPRVADECPNVILFNLDDLKEQIYSPERNSGMNSEASKQLSAVHDSISVRTNEFISWMNENSEITPLMTALRKKAEGIRSEELENALMRLSELTPGQREVISRMSERIVRRLLHEPTSNLKNLARNSEAEKTREIAEVLMELFSLELPKRSESHAREAILAETSQQQTAESEP